MRMITFALRLRGPNLTVAGTRALCRRPSPRRCSSTASGIPHRHAGRLVERHPQAEADAFPVTSRITELAALKPQRPHLTGSASLSSRFTTAVDGASPPTPPPGSVPNPSVTPSSEAVDHAVVDRGDHDGARRRLVRTEQHLSRQLHMDRQTRRSYNRQARPPPLGVAVIGTSTCRPGASLRRTSTQARPPRPREPRCRRSRRTTPSPASRPPVVVLQAHRHGVRALTGREVLQLLGGRTGGGDAEPQGPGPVVVVRAGGRCRTGCFRRRRPRVSLVAVTVNDTAVCPGAKVTLSGSPKKSASLAPPSQLGRRTAAPSAARRAPASTAR